MMDISRNRANWLEQMQVVSFRWPRHDLDDLIDDIAAIAPGASIRRLDEDGAVDDGETVGLDGIVLELPDDAGVLNRTIGAIFHLSGDMQPAIKVSRGLRSRAPEEVFAVARQGWQPMSACA